MFGRNKGGAATGSAGATVIAAGARFKGELQVEGDLEVRGQVNGTIQLIGGVLRIMQGGSVEGEVSAPHVIINGLLEGTCTSAEVEILESGKMQGIFKGGQSLHLQRRQLCWPVPALRGRQGRSCVASLV